MKSKVFFATFLEKLLYIVAANVMTVLVKIILNVIIIPIVDEAMRDSTDVAKANALKIYAAVYVIAFIIFLAILVIKNPSTRATYLNDTYGKEYSFKNDLLRISPLPLLCASALMALPMSLVLAIFGDIKVVPFFFVPYYSMWEIVRNPWLSFGIMTILTAVAVMIFSLIAFMIWEKNRLRK
ncbi:MAG: hypothetical protein J5850_01345 [Clostridia bacterium]|nr:hypothetical protein [Clostridia bacterium]